MEKKHIISLGGELASGKGVVSKILMKSFISTTLTVLRPETLLLPMPTE